MATKRAKINLQKKARLTLLIAVIVSRVSPLISDALLLQHAARN